MEFIDGVNFIKIYFYNYAGILYVRNVGENKKGDSDELEINEYNKFNSIQKQKYDGG